jgi:hypothetical protein
MGGPLGRPLKGSHVNAQSHWVALGGTTLFVAIAFAVGTPATPAAAATPPPTPPPIGAPASPQPNATVFPASTMTPASLPSTTPYKKTSATPSPPPNARKGLDGVWEVQIQRDTVTDYTHFKLTQEGDALTGTYLDSHNKKYPLSGTVDGQAIRLIVAMPNGTTLLMEGKLDGTTDMVGELTMPTGEVPFTASYRAKEKWIENVSPSPGGMPSSSGGGYTPP